MTTTTTAMISPAKSLALLGPEAVAEWMSRLTKQETRELPYRWDFWARPEQREPSGSWRIWLVLAGRGFGKTRTGAEWVRDQIENHGARRVALVAPTAADARDVMVEGESGILAACPPWNRPTYEPSKRRLTWPNGAIATTYSADEPERLRGPQYSRAWCDEVGSWRRPEAFDMLRLGLRIGENPRCCVTTTPKPVKLVKALSTDTSVSKTGGSTYDNRANLADEFIEEIEAVYEGTRLGRQEIHAELLEISEGVWFPSFDPRNPGRHITTDARYTPGVDVHLAIDCGVSGHTGAVFFQVFPDRMNPHRCRIHVFADYYAFGLYSEANAEAIHAKAKQVCGKADIVRLDPASTARTGVGPAAYGEYERVFGGRHLAYWPQHPVADGLDMIEVMLGAESRPPELLIHPDCTRLIDAFKGYRHKEQRGEFLPVPKDPDHPHEDMMDALRGGLRDRFPGGRKPDPKLIRVPRNQLR